MIGKLRPQIFLAILVLGILAWIGIIYEMPEVATGTIGGVIALGMKVLEAELRWLGEIACGFTSLVAVPPPATSNGLERVR